MCVKNTTEPLTVVTKDSSKVSVGRQVDLSTFGNRWTLMDHSDWLSVSADMSGQSIPSEQGLCGD